MTPTERAKRSDALYYETVSVTRRVLCDMIANREADLEDARESVKRLMTQRDERLARAETDNAKLRKLVSDVYTLHWNGLDCTECPWFDECDTTGGCPWLSILADHMRELGVDE